MYDDEVAMWKGRKTGEKPQKKPKWESGWGRKRKKSDGKSGWKAVSEVHRRSNFYYVCIILLTKAYVSLLSFEVLRSNIQAFSSRAFKLVYIWEQWKIESYSAIRPEKSDEQRKKMLKERVSLSFKIDPTSSFQFSFLTSQLFFSNW